MNLFYFGYTRENRSWYQQLSAQTNKQIKLLEKINDGLLFVVLFIKVSIKDMINGEMLPEGLIVISA